MHKSIQSIHLPLTIVHGGNDFLSSYKTIERFIQIAPSPNKQLLHYPNAFHLLLYDSQKEKIFTDLLDWLHSFNQSGDYET